MPAPSRCLQHPVAGHWFGLMTFSRWSPRVVNGRRPQRPAELPLMVLWFVWVACWV